MAERRKRRTKKEIQELYERNSDYFEDGIFRIITMQPRLFMIYREVFSGHRTITPKAINIIFFDIPKKYIFQ